VILSGGRLDKLVAMDIDPRTPVIVGVGQVAERIEDPDYRRRSPVELAAEAARGALADSGAPPNRVAEAVDTVAGVRQFEISHPRAIAPLGRSNNFPRSVAGRVGAAPRRSILTVAGGQVPQQLVTELAGAIAEGHTDVALAFGAEALSTVQLLAAAEDRPDWSETVEGQLDDRGYDIGDLVRPYQLRHGLTSPLIAYALFENARRARLKLTPDEYARAEMGELFAPFTEVAAANPLAAARVRRDATELIRPGPRNRLIAEPYSRYLVAREKVNQGAAVLLVSGEAADRLGVPAERRVYLHGHADLRERDVLERPDLGRSPASVAATRLALELAGVGVDDLATIDLYSCFPVAVSVVREGLGLAIDDPRGLTVTGGLPFFGGPGNNYSMHAIAETVCRARATPGARGLVGANGGALSKYSAGVYSTTPVPWRPARRPRRAELDAAPAPVVVERAEGWATVETYTVAYREDGGRIGTVVGRLAENDARFLAVAAHEETLDALGGGEPIGLRVRARANGEVNHVTVG
jgi:acetyl-CoA C-acetyltransferase